MKIVLKTQVIPQTGDPNEDLTLTKEVAIVFDTQSLADIVKSSGLEAGNEAMDKMVSKYVVDIKGIISKVINK